MILYIFITVIPLIILIVLIVGVLGAVKKRGSWVKVLSWLFKILAFFGFISALISLVYVFSNPSLLTISSFISSSIYGIIYLYLAIGLAEEKKWAWWSGLVITSILLILGIGEIFLEPFSLRTIINLLLFSVFPAFVIILLIKGRKVFLEKPKEKISQLIRDYRFLVVLLGIILIFFISVGIFTYSTYQTYKKGPVEPQGPAEPLQGVVSNKDKDETAGWKTYRNEEYGFEFSYPAYFTNIENEKLNKHPNYGGDYYFSVLISQPEDPTWKYLRYFQVEVTNGVPSESIFKLRSSDVTVGNDLLKIYWFIGGEDVGVASFGQIPIQKNNRWFLLNIKRESQEELENDFRRILSTFRFLE